MVRPAAMIVLTAGEQQKLTRWERCRNAPRDTSRTARREGPASYTEVVQALGQALQAAAPTAAAARRSSSLSAIVTGASSAETMSWRL
jgi:hypothetical protein